MLCYTHLWRYICGRVLDIMAEGEIIVICFHNSELSNSEGESDRYKLLIATERSKTSGERAMETTDNNRMKNNDKNDY